MNDPARLFKALSEQVRLDMIALITMYGELCVCDFEGVLRIRQSKASRHLSYLANAGLLQKRRSGAWMYYRLSDELSVQEQEILALVPSLLGEERILELQQALQAWLSVKDDAHCLPGSPSAVTGQVGQTDSEGRKA